MKATPKRRSCPHCKELEQENKRLRDEIDLRAKPTVKKLRKEIADLKGRLNVEGLLAALVKLDGKRARNKSGV
jgi:uncharacterized protein with WD repeat